MLQSLAKGLYHARLAETLWGLDGDTRKSIIVNFVNVLAEGIRNPFFCQTFCRFEGTKEKEALLYFYASFDDTMDDQMSDKWSSFSLTAQELLAKISSGCSF